MSKRTIWQKIRQLGYSEKATAAIMGNMWGESLCLPGNVEDRCPKSDEDYTAQVNDKRISRDVFAHDSYGYGLCQWTYFTRKYALWDFTVGQGYSIADEGRQILFMEKELSSAEYLGVKYALQNEDLSLLEMVSRFCAKFENPAVQNNQQRTKFAEQILQEFAGTEAGMPADSTPVQPADPPVPDEPLTPYWPPRTLDLGMAGADVAALQALLVAHDYAASITGVYDKHTRVKVMAYQGEHGLAADGIAGPMTWGAILRR